MLYYEQTRQNIDSTITRGWALDRVHNSSGPLDSLFALCDPVTLTFDQDLKI